MQAVGLTRADDRTSDAVASALAPAEYGYYFVVLYTVLGTPLGLILMGGIGSGFLLIPILALCVVALGDTILTVLRTAWIPIACGVTYLFIQLVFHGESVSGQYVYEFGPWIFSLIIAQTLTMYRPNFLHRFAWFTLFLGLAILPFVTMAQGAAGFERMKSERGIGYGHPNTVAAWFGFCVVYMTIKGYVETLPGHRLAAWGTAVVSLYVVTLTVSRGALIAVAIALLVVSRRLLKVGFFPVLLLVVLLLGLLELGVFDQALYSYNKRGVEETGRLRIWPVTIERFFSSPAIGVGAANAGMWVRDNYFTPHNGFLLIAVASGIIPLALFCAYCLRSGLAALRAAGSDRNFLFYLPLVVYTVLITNAGNMDFMLPWAVVSLAAPFSTTVTRINEGDEHASLRAAPT